MAKAMKAMKAKPAAKLSAKDGKEMRKEFKKEQAEMMVEDAGLKAMGYKKGGSVAKYKDGGKVMAPKPMAAKPMATKPAAKQAVPSDIADMLQTAKNQKAAADYASTRKFAKGGMVTKGKCPKCGKASCECGGKGKVKGYMCGGKVKK